MGLKSQNLSPFAKSGIHINVKVTSRIKPLIRVSRADVDVMDPEKQLNSGQNSE